MKDYKVTKEVFSEEFCQQVYAIVQEIPAGQVTTYGDIARLLGMPQCSRLVGRALKEVPRELDLPCHRVVNAAGRTVPGWEEQRTQLLMEGITFRKNGTVDMKLYQWRV